MRKKAVVALGGNALIKDGQEGNIHEQFANTR
jgi:carbamate kinase